jgi:iron complex transport system ATP-binding protein
MLALKDVSINYSDRNIISNISLDVKAGEIVSIIGPNGTGKSTILKAVSKRITVAEGTILFNEQELTDMTVKEISKQMCMVSQANTSPHDMTVGELVGYGRLPYKKWYERMSKEDEEIIQWALQQTGLESYRDRLLQRLSGGEAQRAWIAMALAQKPKILLLDEPTTYLDIAHQLEVLDLIKRLNKELGLTVVMVLHDLNHAAQYSDKICVIHRGEVHAYGTPAEIMTNQLIGRVYGVEAEVQHVNGKPRIHIIKKSKAKDVSRMMNIKAMDIEVLKKNYQALVGGAQSVFLSTIALDGAPFLSYAPFVEHEGKVYVYLSQIAEHYRNLEANPAVDVMLVADESATKNIFARERARFQGQGKNVGNEGYEDVFAKFEEKFGTPTFKMLRTLDFSLFEFTLAKGRYVVGFGQAFDVDFAGEHFEHINRDAHGLDTKPGSK